MKPSPGISIIGAAALLLVLPISETVHADECTIRDDGLVLHSGRTWPGVWWPACGPFPVSDYDASNISKCETNTATGQRRIFVSNTNAMIVVNQGVDVGNLCDGKLRSGWSQVAARHGEGSRPDGRMNTAEVVTMPQIEIRETLNGPLGANIKGCARDPAYSNRLLVTTTNSGTRIVKNEPSAVEECARLGFALPSLPPPVINPPPRPPGPPPAFVSQQLSTSCVGRQYRSTNQELQIAYVDLINQCGTPVRIDWQSFANGSPQTGAGAGVGHSGCIKPGQSFSTTVRIVVGATSENKAVRVVTCQ